MSSSLAQNMPLTQRQRLPDLPLTQRQRLLVPVGGIESSKVSQRCRGSCVWTDTFAKIGSFFISMDGRSRVQPLDEERSRDTKNRGDERRDHNDRKLLLVSGEERLPFGTSFQQ